MASSRPAGDRRRRWRALWLLVASPIVVLLLAGSAAAAPGSESPGGGDIGDAHSPQPQSPLAMIGLYLGIPAAGFLIAFLLSLRSGQKSDRYRPGQPWEHDAAWFGSSQDESQTRVDERRRSALPGAGGAGGRW